MQILITFGVSIATMKPESVRPLSENNFELFQRVVECYGVAEDGWLKIRAIEPSDINFKYYEIHPDRFIKTFEPKFLRGQSVYVPRKSSEATIYGISWHFKREEYTYTLVFDGKKSIRRYFAEEMEKINE